MTTTTPTAADLREVFRQLGAVNWEAECCCPCPVCQPMETDASQFKMRVSPGRTRLFVLYCFGCCDTRDRATFYRWLPLAINRYNFPPTVHRSGLEPELVRSLWRETNLAKVERTAVEETVIDRKLLDRVYTAVLDRLQLTTAHGDWLQKRGLAADFAERVGYRSSSVVAAGNIARDFYRDYGEQLFQVPGFVRRDGSPQLLLRESAIVTPCRDFEGLLLGLKLRLLDGKKGRMRQLSSNGYGGPKAPNFCHCPLQTSWSGPWSRLFVTEGERKADTHTRLRGLATIGVPGVGNWKTALPAIQSLALPGASIVVAFDQDGKPGTVKASEQLLAAVADLGFATEVARWTGAKGIDDAAVAGLEVSCSSWVQPVRERGVNFPYTFPADNPKPKVKSLWLADDEILPWLQSVGRKLRDEVPAYPPTLSRLIREGRIKMWHTPRGQVIEVNPVANSNSG